MHNLPPDDTPIKENGTDDSCVDPEYGLGGESPTLPHCLFAAIQRDFGFSNAFSDVGSPIELPVNQKTKISHFLLNR